MTDKALSVRDANCVDVIAFSCAACSAKAWDQTDKKFLFGLNPFRSQLLQRHYQNRST